MAWASTARLGPIGLLWVASALPSAADAATSLDVIICDSARVPPAVLASAQRTTSRILGKAGVEARWLECSTIHVTDVKDVEHDIACHRPRDPGHIVLEVLPEAAAASGLPREMGGFAWVPRDGQPGQCAGVFYDRARGLARQGDATLDQILAHLMAHEIGHLLLGTGAHSPVGIMRPAWSRADMAGAAWGRLTFEARQVEEVRSGAAARRTQRVASE